MKIVSINVNGIRAFHDKGSLFELIKMTNPDVIFMQEIKCDSGVIEAITNELNADETICNWKSFSNSNKSKSGYAGVAIFIREELADRFRVTPVELMKDSDSDDFKYYSIGRILKMEADALQFINVYTMNSGGKEGLRELFNDRFNRMIEDELRHNPNLIIAGDLNVVSTEMDYWGNYEDKIDSGPGLYQFEIDDFHKRSKQFDLVDVFRILYPDQKAFSWYSYRGGAYRYNKGWRLDYFLMTTNILRHAEDCKIYQSFYGSDHRPIELILR